jgi:hypothetical protein
LERENNLPANQNARLSETKHPENKANILIYLLSLILLLIIQKERSLLFLDLPEQDATLHANSRYQNHYQRPPRPRIRPRTSPEG